MAAGPMGSGPVRADDFADILPPVAYPPGQPGGRQGGYPGPDDSFGGRSGLAERAGGNGQASRAGEDQARAGRDDPDRWTPPRRQPILVLATMVIAVSLAVILPVAGTLIALALLVLLRAGDLAHRGCSATCAPGACRSGSRPSGRGLVRSLRGADPPGSGPPSSRPPHHRLRTRETGLAGAPLRKAAPRRDAP
jgi:hypothetical protein